MMTAYALVAINILCIYVCYVIAKEGVPIHVSGDGWRCFLGPLQSPLSFSPNLRKNNMPGETDLKAILQSLSPIMLDETYVFCTVVGASYGDYA